ncbi:unnamed protein product, partial [Sphenostylis stenocarpa]
MANAEAKKLEASVQKTTIVFEVLLVTRKQSPLRELLSKGWMREGALEDFNYGEAENGSTLDEVVVQWLHTLHAMQSERKKERMNECPIVGGLTEARVLAGPYDCTLFQEPFIKF